MEKFNKFSGISDLIPILLIIYFVPEKRKEFIKPVTLFFFLAAAFTQPQL
jgi:hypothetical protein